MRKVILNRTGRNHLLPEIVLVLSNIAIPPSNSLVLTHHDILCNFIEQSNEGSQ